MAKSTYEFEGSELEKWLEEFFDTNKNIASDSAKVNSFIKELYELINNDLDMISLPEGSQGVLYSGKYSDVPMWKIVDSITGQTNEFCYISDTPAGMLMGTQAEPFQELLTKIVGDEIVEKLFVGNVKEFPDTPGLEGIVNFNDFVSQNLAQKYVGNNGDALIFVSDYNPESVLIRTELPTLMSKDSVKTINGIPKSALSDYYEAYKLSDGIDVANQKLVAALSTVSENYLSEIGIIKLESGQREQLVSRFGEEAVSKFVSGNDIITDTSAWTDNLDDPIKNIGNNGTIEDAIKQYIIENNQNSHIKNTAGLDDFITFQENRTYAINDAGELRYDVNKVPGGFTNKQWYDLVSKGGIKVMSETDILNKYKYLADCTQSDIDSFRAYEYFKSKGIDTKNIKSNGILTDVELRSKYSFLDDIADGDMMDSLRTYEFRVTNNIDSNIKSSIYFDDTGKVVGVDFSPVSAETTVKPETAVYEASAKDARNYTSDTDMTTKYVDYDNYTSLEKLQAKQFDYEKRLVSDMIDRGVTSEKGIDLLSTDELKSKYSFIDDTIDNSVIKELQLAEYQNRKYGTNTAENMKIYFDETGSVTAVTNQKYATLDAGRIDTDAKFSTTVDDYLKFADDTDMQSKYADFDSLDKIDKIQAKQLDLELRVVASELGEIDVSAATVQKYIAASGKPLSKLDVVDKLLIKAADGITGGDDKIVKTIGNFTDKCKGISSVAKKAMPVANFVMTIYEIGTTLSVAEQYYENGDYGRAAKTVADFVSIEAGGWAASTAIGTYAMGFGAAVAGPVGIAVGAIASGIVGYKAAEAVVDVASDIGYSFGGWLYDVFHDASDAEVIKRIDPLILDIDGDGFNIEARKKGVNFDLNCDGFAEKINWTSKDGLLSYDIDGNGKIDNGREVFGDYHLLADGTKAKNGFEALIQYDTNGDGIIDKNDEIFSKLRIWIDTSSDGISDSGELKTLQELNIVGIKLGYEEVNRTTETEALIGNVATFVYADNTEGEIGEMWVSSDLYDTVETFMADVSESVEGLPNVRSYGTVSSLHNAMALDETGELQSLVERFVSEEDMGTRMGIVENILWFICDANSVSQYSRGSFIDARKLKVIESFMGQDFMGVNGAVFGKMNVI